MSNLGRSLKRHAFVAHFGTWNDSAHKYEINIEETCICALPRFVTECDQRGEPADVLCLAICNTSSAIRDVEIGNVEQTSLDKKDDADSSTSQRSDQPQS